MDLKYPQRNVSYSGQNCTYMGNTIFLKDRRVCIKLLGNRLEAIQKLQPPTKDKGCRSFAGMVNFLSMFYPELQKLLKPSLWFNKER